MHQVRHFGEPTYFTKAQLEDNSPSRLDGVSPQDEAKWRANTAKLVKAALKRLKLPDWVYQTSMHYINRFFLTRSVNKNDRHLVVGGAVLLASKVQESPRSVQDVAYVLLTLKNAKQHPGYVPDQASLEQCKEGIAVAEQAILFAINFNLTVGVETHPNLAKRLLESEQLWAGSTTPAPEPAAAEEHEIKLKLFQFLVIFLNDCVQTSLCLQFPPQQLAVVALIMAAKRFAASQYSPSSGRPMPPILKRVVAWASDAAWLAAKGLSLEQAADIESQLTELYGTAAAPPPAASAQPQQPHQPAPADSARAPGGQAKGAQARQQQQQPAESPEEGEVPAVGADGNAPQPSGQDHERQGNRQQDRSLRPASRRGDGGVISPAGSHPCVGPTESGARPPEQPYVAARRVSDVDEGEEQVTSVLHSVPDMGDTDEATTPPEQQATIRLLSPNDNGSPNGLTNGNASGSGCGHAEGQPEVSSRAGAQLQKPQHDRLAVDRKRTRATSSEEVGRGGGCLMGECVESPASKVQRVGEPMAAGA